MKQTVISVGDSILLERFPESYDISPIQEIIKNADVRLFNLENVLSDRALYASSYCGGTWLLAKEDTLDDTLSFGFGEYNFRESESEGKFSRVNPVDMERTEKTIKRAFDECDNVIVNIHSHEIKHDTDDEPDDFMIEFCRKCIDAGAFAVIGTGTHQLKAVEIYKGKPIFYSLGNFIFQSDMPFCMPDDFREKYKMPYGLSAKEQVAERAKRGNGGLHNDVNNFRSLMPFMSFDNGRLTGLKLYALRLDMHTGFPALADEKETKIIFDYLCERNKQFGTKIELKDSVIEVTLND